MKDLLLSRRQALKGLALGAGTLLVAGTVAADAVKPGTAPAALPHVAATDPMALALSYVENAKTVDPKKFPNYKPEHKCANCLQSKGKDGEAWVGCNLFPGKLVNAQGWCKAYVPKKA
ncbi:MAG: high-potential iron-sulfur protein [Gammaproteobacteria bacterium]|nr:high-potential iron-sulfur protein [Gammaproteobacteria bacterium]MDE2250423.1 high-potential iron-sulfur protein [Gammaproteobacteria bacterium]